MVRKQLKLRNVDNERVLAAMRKVRRHEFVPDEYVDKAYRDTPLPIGYDQTISQPFIVGAMTQLLDPQPGDRFLEVGTGSGYQAAVLAELVDQVYTIEILEPLGLEAEQRLRDMGYENIHVRIGDGYLGWPEEAPFDAVIVTCAPDHVPQPLIDQLRVGGKMCIPVGENPRSQKLYLLTKKADGKMESKIIFDVGFVPLVREIPDPLDE